ncbi:MAG: hypothetical protein IKU52_00735, partial [Clostridia bacterium]|nr:hypothetical protein [Clostridia bacterium]
IAVAQKMARTGNITIGCRDFSKPDVPKRSKRGNKITRSVFRLFFGMRITDTQTGLRAFPKSVLKEMIGVEGSRYEYETQMLIYMSAKNIPFEEVKISTVYIDDNKSSHFRVVKDSIRIYSIILKYLLSSVTATVIDEGLFFVLKLFTFLSVIPIPLTFTAAFVARAVSSFVNYLINSKVVFKEDVRKKSIVKYYILVVIQILVSALSVFTVEKILRIDSAALSTLIKVIVDTILFFFSFRIQHKWVFNDGKKVRTLKKNKENEDKEDIKPKKKIFRWVYLGFVVLMIAIAAYCILYVRGLLIEYEAKQPQRCVETVMAELKDESKNADSFWTTYGMEKIKSSDYEIDIDVREEYLSLYSAPETEYASSIGMAAEDELSYVIKNGDFILAEILLKAKGPVKTKLAVFNFREWKVASVTPVFKQNDYTVTLPEDFSLCVNGLWLSDDDGEKNDKGEIKYTVSGVYLEPDFVIEDPNGEEAEYVVKNFRVHPEIYDYTLKLPYTLSVRVNGEKSEGEDIGEGILLHAIRQLDKPEVIIDDLYGNAVSYEGGALDFTNTTLLAYDDYTVKVDGMSIPKEAIREGTSKEYEFLIDIIDDLPKQTEYSIAILKANADIDVTDGNGKKIELEKGKSYYDLTEEMTGEDEVPEEVSDEIDVLSVAQKWSLFMSNDYDFSSLKSYMLPDSYQYEVAAKYASSVDRTFFSGHTLLNPAFTDTSVSNFVWITEDSFSVEISLVKHMRLNSGDYVDDEMNDRFYFAKSGGKWLLCGMKEVTENE